MTKEQGRLEERVVTCRHDLDDDLTWPDVQQVRSRRCERTILTTGSVTQASSYALTSVPSTDASAADLARWWQGHWAIENKLQYVRDVTMGEDAHQMDTGAAPQVLAALRNAVLNLVRAAGWPNMAAALMAAALRHFRYTPMAALRLIGVPASGL